MLHFGEARTTDGIYAWGLAAVSQRADGVCRETNGREAMTRCHFGRLMEDAGLSGGPGGASVKERMVEPEELGNASEARRGG